MSAGELRLHVHGMDCADETTLIRRALGDLPGIAQTEFDLVNGIVFVSFDSTRTDAAAILRAVLRTGLHAHPAAVDDAEHARTHPEPVDAHARDRSTVWTAVSGILFAAGWLVEAIAADHWFQTLAGHTHDPRAAVFYGLSAAASLGPMVPRAMASVRHLRLDMHVLVCATVAGAAAIGEWSEGAAVAFLFAVAHRLEAWSIDRARREVAALVGRGPALVAHGAQQTAPVERWIERFAATYTPLVAGAAVVVALVPPLVDGEWGMWFYRALVFLVLACPCALVISTPVTMVAALSSAARRGVLVKGSAALERAADATAATRAALAAAGVTVAGAKELQGDREQTADVVLPSVDDRAMAFLVQHARRALAVVRQNVAIALLTKAAFLVSAVFGFAPLWTAVLADTGATVIVTFNGLRLLGTRE